jgi:DNA repair protein RecN (Recombination protein N)
MVRAGAPRAVVDAVFDTAGSPDLQAAVREMGYDLDEDRLLLTREVSAAGKSSCRIGGRPAAVAQLRDLGEWLVDLHGQHEHQSLLAVPRHLDMLDDWRSRAIHPVRAEIASAFSELQRLRRERDELDATARERAHLIDLYSFQVNEIRTARITSAEEDTLKADHARAANAQRLLESTSTAAEALGASDGGGGALDAISSALRAIEDAAILDSSLAGALEAVRSASYELSEAYRDLMRYPDTLDIEPSRLAEVEERLDLIRTLRRKYGDTVDDVIRYGEETAAKLDRLIHSDERDAGLVRLIGSVGLRLAELADRLSAVRVVAAREFEVATLAELRDLGMEKAGFAVRIEKCEVSAKGADRVEFMISTNPGEPLRPLARVASGGEISRVTLAIKSAMARQDALPTMVFDEIDVGVGGRTASVIADKLGGLSRATQILCITHLAQIASRGDHHYYIEKHESDGRTTVTVTPLDPDERICEVARMIGGTAVTEAVLQNAREMLAAGSRA